MLDGFGTISGVGEEVDLSKRMLGRGLPPNLKLTGDSPQKMLRYVVLSGRKSPKYLELKGQKSFWLFAV